MKPKILILIGILFLTFACSSDDEKSQTVINGDYIGVFERNGNISEVELSFNNGTYTGNSKIEKFPALCTGNYSISSNSIQIQNDCHWTADFDWTLILKDEWSFETDENGLILTKANGDKYILTKQ
ncbi:hypothetical protein [Flammeovirga sp. SJP92]|uniref:hypothetical protein n=1 Tax=Flammeovirga sp. SJP92 TaxID=1775430 RepID=UPI00078728CA|nr:hypothetical protein [Flammeovirga sp. SJP92]KXX66799.1 hypothetical protein AVL50_30160 [Flammeovirga sp. SJP92]